ncbi:transposase [Microbulbifer sp.]|uniref:transposase n=1 Tax=Microbulbifer sp. TaxID=1908541 RepID=UPI003F304552
MKACERYGWLCHAYCLMSNHYHLLLETGTPSLSKGMKYINGTGRPWTAKSLGIAQESDLSGFG